MGWLYDHSVNPQFESNFIELKKLVKNPRLDIYWMIDQQVRFTPNGILIIL